MSFVSLHNQTDYSILDSLISIEDLFKKAKELGQPAVAITDHGTLAAAWEGLKESKKTGVKLIIGVEFYFQDDNSKPSEKLRHLILLAKNNKGYQNLLSLNRKGFDTNSLISKKIYSIIDWKMLEEHSEGLICITACGNGIISQPLMNRKFDVVDETIVRLKNLFKDDFAIEIQPNNMKRFGNDHYDEIDQQLLNKQLINYANKHDVKVIPACNSHYLDKDDSQIHDAFLAIGSKQPVHFNFRLKYNVPDFYLKSEEEVKKFFSRNFGEEFANTICDNTLYFANKCETPDWIDPKFTNPSGKELPEFPIQDEADYNDFLTWKESQSEDRKLLDNDKLYLRFKTEKFFKSRLPNLSSEQEVIYRARVEEELDVFYHCGVSSYMLIVADYIDFCVRNNIPTGPGRGSVGGSLIGFILNIHQADPIKYGLIFPRFHNKLKVAYSDIDADFSKKYRGKVIEYIIQKYGSVNVASISNTIRITPKVYARDICRAFELGGDADQAVKLGNDIADSIPKKDEDGEIETMDEAMEVSPLFASFCGKYKELLQYKKICEKPRSLGTHAAGIVIGKRPLVSIVPLRLDSDNNQVLELDKDLCEENSLVKMDILGLSTLDIIADTLRLIKESGKEPPVFTNELVESYDKPTYDLISRGDTFKVFQFGTSGGTIALCKKMNPKSIEDLAIITTLARPASKEIREDFILTREGKKKVKPLHNSLKNALSQTYGFPLYDESLLVLAKDVAGWDLNEADKLRKLTKEKGKNPQKVKKWKQEFIEGSVKNNISESDANMIWEKIVEPYGKYSFNKSHAVLYSMISFITAYLKAHFPVEFLLANLSEELKTNKAGSEENVEKIKKEIRDHKVKILPPNVNTSELHYKLINKSELLTGFDAIASLGDVAIQEILDKRPFTSFFDFMSRVDASKIKAGHIKALVAAGAIDSFGMPRRQIFLYCSDYREKLRIWMKKADKSIPFNYDCKDNEDWTLQQLYALECEYIGEGFICKPAKAYSTFFATKHFTWDMISKMKDKAEVPSVKGIVKDIFEFRVKKEGSKYFGQPMAKLSVEDIDGNIINCTVFPDRLKSLQDRLKQFKKTLTLDKNMAIHFSGVVNHYENEVSLIFDKVYGVATPPDPPSKIDRASRKIVLRIKSKQEKLPENNISLQEDIEDSLYSDGLIDLKDDE